MNGDTIDSIEAILTGDENIPERVSNRLILSAVRANYQLNETTSKLAQKNHEDIEELRISSNRTDKILAAFAAVATGLGIIFGNK